MYVTLSTMSGMRIEEGSQETPFTDGVFLPFKTKL
jgi:hypothetical protein